MSHPSNPTVSTDSADRQLRLFAEAVADRYWETDAEFGVLYVVDNRPHLEFDPAEMNGSTFWGFNPEQFSDGDRTHLAEVFGRKEAFRNLAYTRTREDKSQVFVSLSAFPRYDDNGAFKGYFGISTNVTQDRLRELEAARVQNQLFQSLEQLRAGVILWDKDGRFVFCNEYFRSLQGDAGKFLGPGIHISDLMRKISYAPHLKIQDENREAWIQNRLPDPDVDFEELELDRADGKHLIARRQVLNDGSQVVLHIDQTERRALERAKDEFIAVTNHELRTPLTSVMGAIGLVKSGVAGQVPEELSEMLDISYRNCERLAQLIGDILDLSKVETGKLDLTLERVSLMELVGAALEVNADYARTKSIALEDDTQGAEAIVEGDKRRLVQVLTNLISNAVKFTPQNGIVKLAADVRDGIVRFSVIDTGPGISPDIGEKIFEKFFQVDASDARSAEGTGLGLAISKAIVEHHGGRLWYESELGQGSQFHFELPRVG